MSGGEPTLTESPVPLALARLQGRPGRLPGVPRRTHRPSLPLASLQEAVDETPRRYSEEQFETAPDTDDDDETFTDLDVVFNNAPPRLVLTNGRRASDATFAERYRKLNDFDGPPPEPPRRASLAVPVGLEGFSPGDKGRRRSWAARLQLERKKRRKSGGNDTDEESDTPTGYVRQKRPSWWNVFVPDNMLKNRSRRASQQLSRSAESIDQSFKRSKSRSVDHGFAAPFDLDALRSKVEGRFDAVHRDEQDEQVKQRLPPPPPIKTMTYTVRDRDTLTSVAARFDTTPSELAKLNRLATQFVFPGQNLLVPDKRKDGDKESDGPSESGDNTSESTQGASSEPAQEKEILDSLRPVSPDAPTSSSAPQRFLKINVRHITDGQGVVSGVLLVTPNAVMFDPNVSDTLVMEHGPESYGVIAPMEYVVNAAIFYDIAHMRTHNTEHNAHKAEQAEIYYMNKEGHSPGKDSLLVKDETFPELQAATGEGAEAAEGEERPGSEEDRGGAAFPKAFERELVTPTALQQQTTEDRRKSLLDHHWAIPSKDRMSIDQGSEVSSTTDQAKDESLEVGSVGAGERAESVAESAEGGDEAGDAQHLVKLSYHDSGIDIRDPVLHVTPTNSKKGSLDYGFLYHEIETIPETPETDASMYEWPPCPCDVTNSDAGQCEGKGKPSDIGHDVEMRSLGSHDEKMTKEMYLQVYSDADIVLSADWVPPVCLPRAEPPLSAPPLGENDRVQARKPAAVSFSLDGSNNQKEDREKPDKKNKMLKRLSYPLSWVEGLTGEGGQQGSQGSQSDSLPTSADSHNSTSVFSKVFNSSPMNLVELGTGLFLSKTPSEETPHDVFSASGRSSLGGFGRSQTKSSSTSSAPVQPRLDYRSMVSVDDMPDLFASFDKLIPRPARASDDPPLYLRLRMGKPAGRPLPRTTPLMSYGRKRMKPEYWFGIPRNRVDDLFKFLTHWVPDRYGPLGDVTAQGFELIDSDTEWDDDDAKPGQKERTGSTGDVSDITRESWELLKAPYVKIYSIMKSQAEALGDSLGEEPRPEVLSMSDELRRALYSSGASVDMEFCPPDLIGTSEIFTMEHREVMRGATCARARLHVVAGVQHVAARLLARVHVPQDAARRLARAARYTGHRQQRIRCTDIVRPAPLGALLRHGRVLAVLVPARAGLEARLPRRRTDLRASRPRHPRGPCARREGRRLHARQEGRRRGREEGRAGTCADEVQALGLDRREHVLHTRKRRQHIYWSRRRQVRAVAGRGPVPGPHAALHDVRQRAAEHARGLHRQDHGVLDLHLNAPGTPGRRHLPAPRAERTTFLFHISKALDYLMKICYEDSTLLQVSLFNFSTDESDDFCIRVVTRDYSARRSVAHISSQTY